MCMLDSHLLVQQEVGTEVHQHDILVVVVQQIFVQVVPVFQIELWLQEEVVVLPAIVAAERLVETQAIRPVPLLQHAAVIMEVVVVLPPLVEHQAKNKVNPIVLSPVTEHWAMAGPVATSLEDVTMVEQAEDTMAVEDHLVLVAEVAPATLLIQLLPQVPPLVTAMQ